MVLRLADAAWESSEPAAPAAEEHMEMWGVGAVASWLESMDMAGPAASLKAQGVSGKDLIGFETEAEFVRDLCTTPFVARKVLMLRDQHLSSHA